MNSSPEQRLEVLAPVIVTVRRIVTELEELNRSGKGHVLVVTLRDLVTGLRQAVEARESS